MDIELTWSKLLPLDETTILSQPEISGVYRLSYKSADGSYYVFYVGNAKGSLRDKLLRHISEDETNVCVKTTIKNLDCYFKVAKVSDEKKQMNIVRTMYAHYSPKCNLDAVVGELVKVNLN